jgi:hypothetical protein
MSIIALEISAMRRIATTLLIACWATSAVADTVFWASSDYTGTGYVFDRQAPGGVDIISGPALVSLSYNTTGPTDLSITVSITGPSQSMIYSVFAPYGQIFWSPGNLEFYAQYSDPQAGGLIDKTMDLVFFNPMIPYTGGRPLSLAGLTAANSQGHGQSYPPQVEKGVSIFGVPEPSGLVLLATGAVGLVGYGAWRRARPLA